MNTQQRPGRLTVLTPILVLGATGKTGRRIVRRLQESGHPVRKGSRRSEPPFDWKDASTWDAVLTGVGAAYISYAPDLAIPGAADAVQAFVECAERSGLRRLVLLSGRGEEEAQRCERIVQRADLDWTIVRCSWFCQNFSEGAFLDMVLGGEIALPVGDVGEPFVDADDIADVAAAALTEEGHAGQIYELTGPRLLTFAEAAEQISSATGRDLQYIEIPHEAFTNGIAQAGLPEDLTWLLDYLFVTVLDGRNAAVAHGVQKALGRGPRDFADFARAAAASGVWSIPA